MLPDTYLFSPGVRWLVKWLCENFTITHSINVPIEAFEPHCRAKTSILILRKQKPSTKHKITGVLTESFGENKHGTKLYRLDASGRPTDVREDEMSEAVPLLSKSVPEQKLKFTFQQSEAKRAGVLVASYFWRKPYAEALAAFADENDCEVVELGHLVSEKVVHREYGHGSPASHFKGKGAVPYIKVVDIKNWRLNENPKYFIPDDVAAKLRRGKSLQPFDLVTPTRASKNIGLLGVVMPWQTQAILTREIAVLRSLDSARASNWLFLVMMSLKVVNDQFKYLVMMQMNREDLGERLLELRIPLPRTPEGRGKWEGHVKNYFEAMANARSEYDALCKEISADRFVDRP